MSEGSAIGGCERAENLFKFRAGSEQSGDYPALPMKPRFEQVRRANLVKCALGHSHPYPSAIEQVQKTIDKDAGFAHSSFEHVQYIANDDFDQESGGDPRPDPGRGIGSFPPPGIRANYHAWDRRRRGSLAWIGLLLFQIEGRPGDGLL